MKQPDRSAFWVDDAAIIPDMGRRRGHQKGQLYQESGWWKARWLEDDIGADGKLTRRRSKPWPIARCEGPGRISKKEAQKALAEKMVEVNRSGPTTRLTVAEFIEKRFVPDHVATLTGNGQSHYRDILKHVGAAFGAFELPEVKAHHVSQWLQAKAGRGYSQSYLKHMRNVLHKVYEHAYQCAIHEGRNPAEKVAIPKSAREAEPTAAYTLEELQAILAHLDSPLWEMFVLGASNSMHAAELTGLRIEHVNLSDRIKVVMGRQVPPGSLYACESLAKGQRTSGKTKNRRRVLPIPEILHDKLRAMIADRPDGEPVFFMPRCVEVWGKVAPINSQNITRRTFGPLSANLGIKVNWHRLRATNATFTGQMLMDDEARRKMMGHGSLRMTQHYTDTYIQQKRAADAIAENLFGGSEIVQ